MKEVKWSELKIGDVVMLNAKKEATYEVNGFKYILDDTTIILLKRLTSFADVYLPESGLIPFFIKRNINKVYLVGRDIEPIKRLESFTF